MRPTWLRYAILTLLAWGFMPEIRRLYDFKTGLFQPVEILSIVPIAMLVPFVWYAIRGGWGRAAPLTRTFASIWLAAYAYGFIIGIVNGAAPLAVIYEFAYTCLPVGMGIWFANALRADDGAYRKIVATLLVIGTVASVYALVQFISPPPWDAMWIYASGFLAAGLPYPYTLRAWGTMNSPGPFADFLVCTILLALPLVSWRKPVALAATLVCCVGLALTFIRVNTIVLGACIAIYVILSPRRTEMAIGIGGIVLAIALVVGIAPSLGGETGTRFVDRLTDRFNTIDTIDNDVSVVTRQLEIEAGLALAIAEPLGQGLGTIGTSAKLDGSAGEAVTLDSGYVSRFEALGYLGMFGYLIVTIGGLARSLVQAIGVASQGERERAVVVVAAVAAQAALVAIDFAVDSHSAFDGILFWLALATAFGYRARQNAAETERIAPRPEPVIGRELSAQ